MISFTLWSGWIFPVKISENDQQVPYEFNHPKVQMQPVKKRSIRVLADSFRLIVKHLQTFSRTKIVPTYSKQGTSSLTKLGFTAYHEGGISRRPILPNAQVTYTLTYTR